MSKKSIEYICAVILVIIFSVVIGHCIETYIIENEKTIRNESIESNKTKRESLRIEIIHLYNELQEKVQENFNDLNWE